MQIKISLYHVYAHDFFLFSHELLMSFTTQFPNSRFDIRMTYLHYYLCKRKIPEYISTTRHHSPDYITGKALKRC